MRQKYRKHGGVPQNEALGCHIDRKAGTEYWYIMMISERSLYATNGHAYPLRTLAWTGAPILDACSINADHGHLLVLTKDGVLCGINLDTGANIELCKIDLPEIAEACDESYFGAPRYRLHVSPDNKYAAIVCDKGQYGLVVEVSSGAVTMHLNGGDYYADTVPFSACFVQYKNRNVLIHRTSWNRLDASDPADGKPLTDRHIAPYESGGEMPEHYLDYFHGQLLASPDGSRIFDDGWFWHPVSIPRAWSITEWLSSNPWESEDGASIVDLSYRDDWNTPACWISEQHIALWGVWDEEESQDAGQGTGVRIFDVTERTQPSDGQWLLEVHAKSIESMFSDGRCLYIAADTGTTVWDLASRSLIADLPGFTARWHSPARNTLIANDTETITEFPLAPLTGNSNDYAPRTIS